MQCNRVSHTCDTESRIPHSHSNLRSQKNRVPERLEIRGVDSEIPSTEREGTAGPKEFLGTLNYSLGRGLLPVREMHMCLPSLSRRNPNLTSGDVVQDSTGIHGRSLWMNYFLTTVALS